MTNKEEKSQGGSALHETFEKVKANDKFENIVNYAKANNRDTAAFCAMLLGAFIIYFIPFYGGTIVGVVTGLYFTKEIITPLRNLERFIEELGMVRSLLFGVLLLALFISAPMIFIAALVTVFIKQLIIPEGKRNSGEKE